MKNFVLLSLTAFLFSFDTIAQVSKNKIILNNYFQNHTLSNLKLTSTQISDLRVTIKEKQKTLKRSGMNSLNRPQQFYVIEPFARKQRKNLIMSMQILFHKFKSFQEISFWNEYATDFLYSVQGDSMRIHKKYNETIIIRKFANKTETYFFVLILGYKNTDDTNIDKIISWWKEARIEELKDYYE